MSNCFEKGGLAGPGTTCSTMNSRPLLGACRLRLDRMTAHSRSLQSFRIIFGKYASATGTSSNLSPAPYRRRPEGWNLVAHSEFRGGTARPTTMDHRAAVRPRSARLKAIRKPAAPGLRVSVGIRQRRSAWLTLVARTRQPAGSFRGKQQSDGGLIVVALELARSCSASLCASRCGPASCALHRGTFICCVRRA
jgi:hypothetical protein